MRRLILRNAISELLRLLTLLESRDGDGGIQGCRRVLVDDEDVEPVVLVLHGIDAEIAVVTLRLDHSLPAACERFQQFVAVERRIAGSGAGRISRIDDAVVAVAAPAIKRRAVV